MKVLIEESTIQRAIDDFDGIQQAIIGKGVSVPPGTPTSNYPAKIKQISGEPSGGTGDGWTRPIDRPEKPDIQDNTILMLFGVGEKSPNDMAFSVTTTPTTGYTVNWGDGNVTTHVSNTKAEHLYVFDGIDKPIDSRGYKMVWITIRPTVAGANIAAFNTQQRPSLRSGVAGAIFVPQLFELYIKCPQLTSITWPSASVTIAMYYQLEIFALHENNITGNVSYMLGFCRNLKKIEALYIDKISSISYFMYSCYSYNQPFPDGVTFNNVTSDFMYSCYSYNQPFPSGVTFNSAGANFMQTCYSYNQPFPSGVTFNNVTTGFMGNCSSYNHDVTVNLNGRSSAIGTGFIGTACYALKGLRLQNMGTVHTALTISNSSLDVNALVALFGDLADRTATTIGTITISNCYGAARLTAADRLIATEKNWTIAG